MLTLCYAELDEEMRKPAPSKMENGFDPLTSAELIRHSKSASVAPAGCMAICAVVPRPFFQGIEA